MASRNKALEAPIELRSTGGGLLNFGRSRVATMPLAVLLPRLGEISDLQRYAAQLERRLQELHEAKKGFRADETEEAEEQPGKSAEESMLNQVFQWLSVGTEEVK